MDRIYSLYKLERLLYKYHLTIIAFLIRFIIRVIFSCDIPYKCEIGSGTTFPHDALGVVIHPNAVIGHKCKILHGVTIGGRSGYKNVPKIGNNVLVGVNSSVLGPITIGDNAIIAAGAVVISDVPSNAIVAGVPAKEIKIRDINKEKFNENSSII